MRLRVSGKSFAVREFLLSSSLEPCVVFDGVNNKGGLSKTFGFNVTISEAEFDNLESQILDAVSFLKREHQELKRLVNFAATDGVSIDFPIASPSEEIVVWTRSFPPELLGLLGSLRIRLDFTIYPESYEEC